MSTKNFYQAKTFLSWYFCHSKVYFGNWVPLWESWFFFFTRVMGKGTQYVGNLVPLLGTLNQTASYLFFFLFCFCFFFLSFFLSCLTVRTNTKIFHSEKTREFPSVAILVPMLPFFCSRAFLGTCQQNNCNWGQVSACGTCFLSVIRTSCLQI